MSSLRYEWSVKFQYFTFGIYAMEKTFSENLKFHKDRQRNSKTFFITDFLTSNGFPYHTLKYSRIHPKYPMCILFVYKMDTNHDEVLSK